jgi:hypothetical protein
MAKKGPKKDERLNIPISYVCVNCGLAKVAEEKPEECENCKSTQFHKILLKANWGNRQPFALDNRHVEPI